MKRRFGWVSMACGALLSAPAWADDRFDIQVSETVDLVAVAPPGSSRDVYALDNLDIQRIELYP